MEYNHNGIQPLWNATTLGNDLHGRHPQWKMTSMEDNSKGRQPQWKTTLMEEDELVLITFKLKEKPQSIVVALLRATLFCFYTNIRNLPVFY